MAMRDMVGTAAKMTAGFWTEVARAVDPPRSARPPSPAAAPDESTRPRGAAGASEVGDGAAAPDPAPLDGVLVPVDTWTRVMDQIGNLHEAGQQLAEARERAARAETQVEFLREQLAEARAKPKPRPWAARSTPAATPAMPPPSRGPAPDRTPARARVSSARNRVSAWLRTD